MVRFVKFSSSRIIMTLIVLGALFLWEGRSLLRSTYDWLFFLIVAYVIAYLLATILKNIRVFTKKKAVVFDMGGVITRGDTYTEIIKFRPGIKELARDLKRKSLVAILSNQNSELYDFLERKFNLSEFADVEIISGKEGIKKPDSRIYKIALKKLGVKGSNTVYIDDMAENLVPAKELGMKTIHFQSVKETREKLKELGFL